MSRQYDIAVIGGGMVGAAAALGLAQAGWQVALVESAAPVPFDTEPCDASSEPELRVSAISHHAVALLRQLGAWQAIEAMRVTPYRYLQTWEQEAWSVNFSADSLGITELGFMVENRVLQLGLWQQLQRCSNLTIDTGSTLETLEHSLSGWRIGLQSGQELNALLVIGADGADSRVRHFAGIGISGWDYRQACMLISIATDREQQDTTWQAFYPSGPRAFLPLHSHYATLAWYDHPQRIRQLLLLPPDGLAREIAQAFPARLGPIRVLRSGSFVLTRRHAQRYVDDGLVLLGDAAHTINPLAGQGVNLGYRDIATLLTILTRARQRNECWHSLPVLRRYQCRRRPDNLLMQTGMDLFYAVFSNTTFPLPWLRNLALIAAENSGKLKEKVLKYAIGL